MVAEVPSRRTETDSEGRELKTLSSIPEVKEKAPLEGDQLQGDERVPHLDSAPQTNSLSIPGDVSSLPQKVKMKEKMEDPTQLKTN